MQLSHPMRVVSAALDADVLSVLAVADAGFSGRQVAKAVSGSVEGVRQVLARLVIQGIVTREPLGSGIIFRLNREHLAAEAVISLATLRLEFFRRLHALVDEWSVPAAFVAVFGSVARGEDVVGSDVDIFVVRPDAIAPTDPAWRAQLDEMTVTIVCWTGNDAQILEFSTEEVQVPEIEPESVLADVLREGIPVAGSLRVAKRSRRRG